MLILVRFEAHQKDRDEILSDFVKFCKQLRLTILVDSYQDFYGVSENIASALSLGSDVDYDYIYDIIKNEFGEPILVNQVEIIGEARRDSGERWEQ